MSGEVRKRAVSALCLVEKGIFSERVLDTYLGKDSGLSDEDRRLCAEILFGVLRRRLTLDHVLSRFVKKPLGETDSFVANALRAGAYQILYLDRVPDHAAVYETVEAVKGERGKSVAGFVNGVLKNVARQGKGLLEGDLPRSVRYSLPEWMMELVERYLPAEDAEEFFRKSLEKPGRFVRLSGGREREARESLSAEGVSLIPHPCVEGIYALEFPGPVERLRAFKDGLITMQDPGSFLVAKAVASLSSEHFPDGGKFLDACAAPGIKASFLREALPAWALMANEPYRERMREMERNFKRLNLGGIALNTVDFTKEPPAGLVGIFDVVFVDTPCTGLGVMRRNPEVKWRVLPEDAGRFARKSRAIVQNALLCLRPGGILFYSTCTITPEENEGVVESSAKEEGVQVLPLTPSVDGEGFIQYDGRYLVTRPGKIEGDFFFLAALRKGGE
ncbi:MAG: hypothetical protein D6713_04655 [Deltaproteobacteria bacterium]|nr:MAG: hypothetical protein D6713_04655 [Deltaproteobacteria bacterium]